ncbi:MAG TPA: hypothetical protein P5550_10825 [Bacteroidales bacterium]|nr:hypothetical protein [Bacteroidales bacterium]HRZ76351.1 hypothetical protein [Bacteroidales bacterium]
MKTLKLIFLVILSAQVNFSFSQSIDSIVVSPASPGTFDPILVTVYGELLAGGVTITRIENNYDLNSNSILINIYVRNCGGFSVVTPFEATHTFPPMSAGNLTVCCSTYIDTNTIPGLNGDCEITDTIIPLYNQCNSYQIVGISPIAEPTSAIEILKNPIEDAILDIKAGSQIRGRQISVSLYNLIGDLQFRKQITVSESILRIPMHCNSPGSYLLIIDDGKEYLLRKKIISVN